MPKRAMLAILAALIISIGAVCEPLNESPPIKLDCASALLYETMSGNVIFEMNADTPRAVASVNKVMTILLALEALDDGRIGIDDIITISPNASGMGGSQVLLDTNEQQPVSVLLKSVIVGSANDAAVALAEAIYGSEELFVRRMNERATELGMTNTVFVNSTGLPAEGQRTTARDVAIMSAAMFAHEGYYEYAGVWLDEVDHGDGRVTQLTNTNKLIRLYEGCDGGKTGSTNEAGYCIAATAERSGMRLIAVVLGADTGKERFAIASDMFDYGFANYRIYPVADKGASVRNNLPVKDGDKDEIALEIGEALTLLLLKGEEQGITITPNLPEMVNAPIEMGETIGSVDVKLDGRLIASIPIIASESVGMTSFRETIRRLFKQWAVCEA